MTANVPWAVSKLGFLFFFFFATCADCKKMPEWFCSGQVAGPAMSSLDGGTCLGLAGVESMFSTHTSSRVLEEPTGNKKSLKR